MKSAVPPVGLTVLVAGNFLWENRITAKIIEGYFPQSTIYQVDQTGLVEALSRKTLYDLVILDEMIVCGDQWVEIFHALDTNQSAAKVVVYGTKFLHNSACVQAYPSLINSGIPKDITMEELVYQLGRIFQ